MTHLGASWKMLLADAFLFSCSRLRNSVSTTGFPRLETAYQAVNFSGSLYSQYLSQQALLRRSKHQVEHLSGTVYRPAEARLASLDSRGLPVSTVVDLRTAFLQGATARAAAQRTVSAVGMALGADALGVMGPKGQQVWGNHPLAVVMRAALPLRIAAWPSVWWNQNLAASLRTPWAGSLQGATLGSGLAEYIVGTGYHDRPDAPQVSPGYMVVAPPAFEQFKSHGVLGIPERLLWHGARRLSASSRAAHVPQAGPASPSGWRHLAAGACLAGALGLRLVNQAFRLPLCAIWSCELLLGGLVGVAHVAANHAMQSMVLAAQQVAAWIGLAEAPSRPMWQHLDAFRADHARELTARLADQQIEQVQEELTALRELSSDTSTDDEQQTNLPAALEGDALTETVTTGPGLLPGMQHRQPFEQI